MSLDLGAGVTVEIESHDPTTLVVPLSGPTGPPGPEGPEGPQGPPGAGVGEGFTHSQSAPAALWQITHNLGYRPGGVVITDTLGGLVEPDQITWPTANIIELTFGVPLAGSVQLS